MPFYFISGRSPSWITLLADPPELHRIPVVLFLRLRIGQSYASRRKFSSHGHRWTAEQTRPSH
ncbi:hypothetical protein B0T14DRAFT_524143 [Immersiella caudata]|uniref:Uncharacterized protein n=1 Tax=Immersiella caudata TaxID=314043 RepID=A0AA39WKB1_9PEZI|nr:hypothetical protein B0T14DRAFT_524143 [Immersiella caudata]